jgi:hypothetical protein
MTANDKAVRASVQFVGDPESTVYNIAEGHQRGEDGFRSARRRSEGNNASIDPHQSHDRSLV